jgi:uncharacterized protein YabE (DUF348 family)/3D (Asp-Asp-Asp) domain-containing protein
VRLPGGPARFQKTQYLVAAVVIAAIVVASASGFVWADKRVTVVVDGVVRVAITEAHDVASLLGELGVRYSSTDLVSPPPGTHIEDGGTVVVRHAVPVTLEVGGEIIRLSVIGRTVADALVAAGFDPTSGMTTDPAVDAPLEAGMRISATEVFMRVVEEPVDVPFDVEIVGDPSAPSGSRRVTTSGVAGKALRIYQVLVVGGVEGPRFLKAEHTIAPAVREVVTVGTDAPVRQVLVSRGVATPSAPSVSGRTVRVTSTAYTPWDPTCIGRNGQLAKGFAWVAGKRRRERIPDGWGIIAVDPTVIPLRSRVFVEGYGYAIACDTGGVIHGNKIDVCFWGADANAPVLPADMMAQVRQARSAAYRWGAKYRKRSLIVTILGD